MIPVQKLMSVICLLLSLASFGQKVNFDWAKQMGGSESVDARGISVVTDKAGNIYSTGFFTGTVDFDPGPGIFTLDPIGGQDFYVSKLDSRGRFLWVRHLDFIGPFLSATGKSITIDANANIYITGEIAESLFTPNCFISKLDSAGNLVWFRRMEGSSSGTSLKTDAAGNVYTTGLFSGTVDLDPGPGVLVLGNPIIFASAAFICKLDSDGNFLMAKEIGGYHEVNPGGGGGVYGQIATNVYIELDASQNIYITGSFFGKVDFDPGPGEFNLTETTNSGIKDMFVLKLTAEGNFSWVKQGIGHDITIGIATDASGNIYTAVNFTGTVDFDPGPGVFNLRAGNGVQNTAILKLDTNGNFIWAKQLAGGTQWCYSMTLDDYGNVYTTGYFGSTLDFDPGPGSYNLSSTGYDVYISKLNPEGNFIWAKQISGTATAISNSIAIDVLGNVITTGYFFSGHVDFDTGPGTFALQCAEGENVYVHKMSQCLANASSVINVTACKEYSLNGQLYTATGTYLQTLTNLAGCDSIVTLNLVINPLRSESTVTTCISYLLNGRVYTESGTYTDTLTTSSGCDSIITLHLVVTGPILTNRNHTICEGQSFEGHTRSGTYTDTLAAVNGCDSIIILQLTVLPPPSPYLGADSSLCNGDSLLLYPGRFDSYTWQNGSTRDRITVQQPGIYSVLVTNFCGSGSDEIVIAEGNCDINFPKAFTPNGDGLNDQFKILRPGNLAEFHLTVFNRWGQIVFETFDYSKGWDGNFKGQAQPVQTFAWYCELKRRTNEKTITIRGLVTLVK
jgi:gliding motility-associated-like protein